MTRENIYVALFQYPLRGMCQRKIDDIFLNIIHYREASSVAHSPSTRFHRANPVSFPLLFSICAKCPFCSLSNPLGSLDDGDGEDNSSCTKVRTTRRDFSSKSTSGASSPSGPCGRGEAREFRRVVRIPEDCSAIRVVPFVVVCVEEGKCAGRLACTDGGSFIGSASSSEGPSCKRRVFSRKAVLRRTRMLESTRR